MGKKIYDYLTNPDIVGLIAKDIVDAFITQANKSTIDYSFDISEGKIKKIESNTFFTFDPDPTSFLNDFKKAMFDEDLKDITNEEEEKVVDDVSSFLKEVSGCIIEKYLKEIRDVIRRVILPQSREEDIPLSSLFLTSIDIADFSSIPEPSKYLIKLGKIPGADIRTDEVVSYIHQRQEEIGGTVEEIFESEKDDNPIFSGITAVQCGDRYLYDVSISMFVDYSLSPPPIGIDKNTTTTT